METIVELFVSVDDFCKAFLPAWENHLIRLGHKKRRRNSRLSISEMITILILFHHSHYRDFKTFYQKQMFLEYQNYFPGLLSYSRFTKLLPRIFIPFIAYLQSLKATSEGIAFIDSTSINVCHSKRISRHKVFQSFAQLGKTTKGWYYGFKLHLLCNHRGELIACRITPGNVDDREPVLSMTEGLKGKLFGDKGYLSQTLSEKLKKRGLELITGIKKNMKNKLMLLFDKLMLRKRSMIESINNQLKYVFQIEHTRHRNPWHGFINMLAAIVAYIHHPNKPSLSMEDKEMQLLKQANIA